MRQPPAPALEPSLGIPPKLTVGAAMTSPAVAVSPATPLVELVARMAGGGRRALPVVDGDFPVGIVTQGDLIARGGLAARLALLAAAGTPASDKALAVLARRRRTTAAVMTPDPVTVRVPSPLREAAETMARRGLKRLPVVDEEGRLAGILSRVDVLRAVAGGAGAPAAERRRAGLDAHATVSAAMRRDPPVVAPGTPLDQVLPVVAASGLDRALVVDAGRRVLGVVTDSDLLERLAPPLRRGLFSGAVHGLAFGRAEREAAERHATARTASEIMGPVPRAPAELPIREAIALVLPGAHKLLAVVDAEGRLLGALDRADILRGLLLGTGHAG
ncbi:MAG TPA: CBS domain-containing protein [Anaeromyxobacter sp.]|nr:CBS domain-containing protein [Anaeromyxobacter sp.]